MFVDAKFLPGSRKRWGNLHNGLSIKPPTLNSWSRGIVQMIAEASEMAKCPGGISYTLCQNLDLFYEDFSQRFPRGFTSRLRGDDG